MSINKPVVESADIIADFNVKLRNYIVANTNWVGGTGVWNTNVANVTGQNNNKEPGQPASTVLNPDIVATTGKANSIIDILNYWMTIYSRSTRIRLYNTGNIGTANYYGVYRFSTSNREVADVKNGANSLINSYIKPNGSVDKSDLETLFSALQTLWINEARNVVNFTFSYYYCHSSCHNSRSRR